MTGKQGYWRIEQMLVQLGTKVGLNNRNHLVCMGVNPKSLFYSCRNDDSKPVPPKWENGFLSYEIGITFRPNLSDKQIKYHIALDSNDTYVFFVTRGSKLVKEERGLQDFNLGEIVRDEYETTVREKQHGFIDI